MMGAVNDALILHDRRICLEDHHEMPAVIPKAREGEVIGRAAEFPEPEGPDVGGGEGQT